MPPTLVGGGARHRTFLRRLGVALVVTSVLSVSLVLSARSYAEKKFNETVATVPFTPGVLTPKPVADSDPSNLLIVGSDSREGLDAPDVGNEDLVSGQRSDVIMLVHTNPRDDTAYVVSIPRDTWVTLDNGRNGRINEAFARGGEAVVKTVQETFDIPIHHYLEVDFTAVSTITDAVGGVTVFVFNPARDPLSGLNIGGGCQLLGGEQGLAWVRSRHFQSYVDGRWVTDPTGDLGRINRQQDFLRRLARTVLERVGSNPFQGSAVADTILRSLTVDDGFRFQDAFDLAESLRAIDTDEVVMTQIPTRLGRVGEASVLFFDEDAVAETLAPFNDVPAPPAPTPPNDLAPGEVRLIVFNGDGTAGLAGAGGDLLTAKGFVVVDLTDADEFGLDETEIRYAEGRDGAREKAELAAFHLGVGRLVPILELAGVDVEVVLGKDFRPIAEEAEAAAADGGAVGPVGPVDPVDPVTLTTRLASVTRPDQAAPEPTAPAPLVLPC